MLATSRRPEGGPSVRTLLLTITLVALFLRLSSTWGWNGSLLLSSTQFPLSWWSWFGIALLYGRRSRNQNLTANQASFLATMLIVAALSTELLYWIRERSFQVMIHKLHGLPYPDLAIPHVDQWLMACEFTPDFWKRNCTHSPIAILLGIVLILQMIFLGVLTGKLVSVRG
jgi:hypothetical protein